MTSTVNNMADAGRGAIDRPPGGLDRQAVILDRRYAKVDAAALVAAIVADVFRGRIALVSSFGTGSAVLLHMVAAVAPATPVLFLDTGKHFGETLRYRDALVARLGLTDLRVLAPDWDAVAAHDARDDLWARHADRCCFIRKTAPLATALGRFDAWLTGRRRGQTATRRAMARIEAADGRFKINPLAAWSAPEIAAYLDDHDLPRHPLEADGFRSIGCFTCTARVAPDQNQRAGRWRGHAKTECGIHLPTAEFKDFGADI